LAVGSVTKSHYGLRWRECAGGGHNAYFSTVDGADFLSLRSHLHHPPAFLHHACTKSTKTPTNVAALKSFTSGGKKRRHSRAKLWISGSLRGEIQSGFRKSRKSSGADNPPNKAQLAPRKTLPRLRRDERWGGELVGGAGMTSEWNH
jgi:hypothetical protein